MEGGGREGGIGGRHGVCAHLWVWGGSVCGGYGVREAEGVCVWEGDQAYTVGCGRWSAGAQHRHYRLPGAAHPAPAHNPYVVCVVLFYVWVGTGDLRCGRMPCWCVSLLLCSPIVRS